MWATAGVGYTSVTNGPIFLYGNRRMQIIPTFQPPSLKHSNVQSTHKFNKESFISMGVCSILDESSHVWGAT